jgi:hypothetical protein
LCFTFELGLFVSSDPPHRLPQLALIWEEG